MIIRKPYAFLIKYFKLIHIILFFFILYLVFKTRNLYIFFRNFLLTGTYTYTENMAFSYINIVMILMTIFLIAMLLLIFFLMKKKEKKVLYYLMATIFYFASFVLFLYFITVFNKLEFSSYSNQSLVLFRDLSMVLYYLNYFFLVIAFIRGFGFNIKKFNFEKDLKELEISDEDREEIEVGSSIDYENVGNFFRKRKRNFKYYVQENSFILIVFLIIGILISTTGILLSKLVVNKVYKIGEVITIGDINYTVNNGYIITKDISGKTIKDGNYYLIVDLSLLNNSSNYLKLDMNNTRIKVDEKYYYPKTNAGSVFEEFGKVYKTQTLSNNKDYDYILVFEINKNIENVVLELYQGKRVVDGEVILYYKEVDLKLDQLEDKDLGTWTLNDEINLDKTYYKRGTFKIIKYELLDIEKFTYKKCLNETNCLDYNKDIVPASSSKLLKIEYSLSLDKDIFNYLHIDGFENEKIKNVTPNNYYENTVLLEIPKSVVNDNMTLLFSIRGTKFRVK